MYAPLRAPSKACILIFFKIRCEAAYKTMTLVAAETLAFEGHTSTLTVLLFSNVQNSKYGTCLMWAFPCCSARV